MLNFFVTQKVINYFNVQVILIKVDYYSLLVKAHGLQPHKSRQQGVVSVPLHVGWGSMEDGFFFKHRTPPGGILENYWNKQFV